MKEISIILPLIFIVGLGYVLRRFGFISAEDPPRFTRLLYWVIMPVQLFYTMVKSDGQVFKIPNLFFATYASTLITVVLAACISGLLYSGDRRKMAFSALSGARPNNLFLGLPTVAIALGDPGKELAGVYFAMALPGDALIPICSAELIHAPAGGRWNGVKKAWRQVIRNPLILSCLSGLIVANLGMKLPQQLLVAFDILSACSAGVATLLLGMMIRIPQLSRKCCRCWSDVLIKLLVHPFILYLCFLLWPVPSDIYKVAMLINVMPNAVNTFIVASGMGLDGEYAVEAVMTSTLLSVISIPLWMKVIGI